MIGAEYNAVTTMENTYYYMYGNSDDTKKIIDIILDIYINPTLETKAINKERKVIIEEMRMKSDMPYLKLYSALHLKMFESTPLAREIIGTEENILSFKRADFVKFREEMYTPDNTVFVVTGNFNSDIIYKMIESALKSIKNPIGEKNRDELEKISSEKNKEIIHNNMSKQTKPFVYLKKNLYIKQVYLMITFPLFNLYDKYSRSIDMLSNILTSGLSSRLYNALRTKKGITYTSSSHPFIYTEGGVFIIKATMHPDEFIIGLKIILAELRKLKKNPIPPDELKKVKNIMTNATLFSLIKPIDYLTYFGLNFLENRNFKPDVEGGLARLKKVTATDIQEIATEIFVKSKINIFVYGNVIDQDFDFISL
jgi:predicted Zn-dependent peptidase